MTVEVHLPMIDGLLLMAITYPYNILSMATTVVEVHLPSRSTSMAL